ncbi:2-phosphosulfolactate phosphatase [Nocardia camponoti]|uniref:Probable 2-phosphosulfolactate phosphatase n=1 Tax=Nocardia camponoti TaxID=1616106 RepID=A0A917Q9Q3_9NOCA|nr:2-phosphosulfolactate phosphatase [Nocardia camponoti]GGK36918.1 hypothetical protein GCM10011591_05770 [Nocardia camponoti]
MPSAPEWAQQREYGLRVDWGRAGANAISHGVACLVVIDVLSFTTTVGIATSRGTTVYPYPWRDASARDFAAANNAQLAVGRREVTEDNPWSLSPAAIKSAPAVERLVLPSPNGSAIAASVRGTPVAASALRNVSAVADWLIKHQLGTREAPIAIIAAGEHWPNGDGLRPAIEDWLGAGLLAAALADSGRTDLSPEAHAAAATARATPNITAAVRDCASGRELRAGGFADDVALAIEIDADLTVPVLVDGAFRAAAGAGRAITPRPVTSY